MRIFLFILFSICSVVGKAQPQVEIDFEKREIKYPGKDQLRENRTVQIKVTNIPTKSYKVSINKSDSIIHPGTPPALFGVLKFGDGFSSLLAGLTGYSIRNAGVVVSTPSTNGKISKSLKIMSLDGGTDEFRPELSADFLTQQDCGKSTESIMPLMKSMRKTVFDFHFKFKDQVVRKADDLIYQYNLGKSVAASFKSDAEKIILGRLKLEKELELEYLKYYDQVLPKYDVVTKCIPLATADSMLGAYKISFSQFLDKFDTTFNETLIAKVYMQLSATAPSTEFISLPYELKGDITQFAIEISGIDATKTPQSYSTSFNLERFPNRLWAFTTGIFVSGLKNDDFSILTNVQPNLTNPAKFDTLNYSIVQESNGGVNAGINALLHFGGYFGTTSEVGGFLTFGPGLTLEKTHRSV